MLETVIENTEKFIASVPKTKRKKYGRRCWNRHLVGGGC